MWGAEHFSQTCPRFSDNSGSLNLKKASFNLPMGWQWEGDWFINPDMSVFYGNHGDHKNILQDVFEVHERTSTRSSWDFSQVSWTNSVSILNEQ